MGGLGPLHQRLGPLHQLGESHRLFERGRLDALLKKHRSSAGSTDLRAFAALAQACVVEDQDPALAGSLRAWAATLRHTGVEPEPARELSSSELAELAQATLRQMKRDSSQHFGLAFTRAAGGYYYPPPARRRPLRNAGGRQSRSSRGAERGPRNPGHCPTLSANPMQPPWSG